MSKPQLCEAARHLAELEGWNPDATTCLNRPVWKRYAEEIEAKYLPAINRALRET